MESDNATLEHELARWVVTQVAPEEQELFGVINDAYQRDPDRVAGGAGSRDEMLGFGFETVAVLMTPVVLAAVAEVVRYLAAEVVGAVGVQGRLRRILRRNSETSQDDSALDAAQLARVREIVLAKCQQAGVEEARSQLLADGVVGALTNGI